MDKQIMFALMVNQERELLLNVLVQMAMEYPDYAETLVHHGLADEFSSFLDDMKENVTKMPWCNHPECRRTNGTNCTHK